MASVSIRGANLRPMAIGIAAVAGASEMIGRTLSVSNKTQGMRLAGIILRWQVSVSIAVRVVVPILRFAKRHSSSGRRSPTAAIGWSTAVAMSG